MPTTDPSHQSVVARRRRILELVRQHNELSVTQLAEMLELELPTLRRDLRLLEGQGTIRRSYGLIAAVETSRYETSLALRAASENSAEKSAIAEAAASLLHGETTIYIDEGYLPQLIAVNLPTERALTIVTPSLPVAAHLAESSQHEVILLGGRVRGRTLGTVDHWAREMLSGFSLEIAFVGANGVTVDAGLTTPDPAVAAIKSTAIAVSRRKIFIGDHTKFGVTSFARFARISDIDLFVTGEKLSAAQTRRFTDGGAQFLRV
ncbi:MAG: DeoR/GlpR family DNA-binding transcription regulator [Microbacteriaceae bacterium]